MARRLRITPFARLFLLLIFVAPAAYLGVSYYKGEDPIANAKDLLNIEKKPSTNSPEGNTKPEKVPTKKQETNTPSTPPVNANATMQKDIQVLQERLRFQVDKNDELQAEINNLKKAVADINAPVNRQPDNSKAQEELQQKFRYQVEKNDELRDEVKALEEKIWQLEQENKKLKREK